MSERKSIFQLGPLESELACRAISASLPEWFGIPEANEKYAKGVKERLSFGYMADGKCLGMLSLEFPFPSSANIYWMGVRREHHGKGIGAALLRQAETICLGQNIYSLTVETLSPKANDAHYLRTYEFYRTKGFKPLFELQPYGPDLLMAYLQKILSPMMFKWVDLTHELSEAIPCWEGNCGFQHRDEIKYEDCAGDAKFLVQRLDMLAGVGTHIDAPSHCFANGKTVAELSLQSLMSPCVVIDVSKEAHENYLIDRQAIEVFENRYGEIERGTFVIFYTGWENYWPQPEKYRNHYRFPSLAKQSAEYLLSKDVAGIGIDTLSPDRPESGYPVHQIILGAGKYIIENIANASRMPATGGYTVAMPVPIAGGSEAPMRLLGARQ